MTEKTMFEMVGQFHDKMGLANANDTPPRLLTHDQFKFRTAFLAEELIEFVECHGLADLPGCADALVDLAWVAMGTAHLMGVPFDACLKHVFDANMQKRPWKEGDKIKPRNNTAGEIVKPEGWQAPDHFEALAKHKERVRARE